MNVLSVGLIVNPAAGLGGPLALKGSDDIDIAVSAEDSPAVQRAAQCLRTLATAGVEIRLQTWGGLMGAASAERAGVRYNALGSAKTTRTSAEDTQRAAEAMASVDLLLFAGGDGTAQDIAKTVGSQHLCLGIPAGVKMHSGVFALSPSAAARLVEAMATGQLVASELAEVRDIDEAGLRDGHVRARTYGHLRIPAAHQFVQTVKSGGREVEALAQEEIAAELLERMSAGGLWILGPGGTLSVAKSKLAGDNTLLGVDVARDGRIFANDLNRLQLEELLANEPGAVWLAVSPTGGQGFVLGRGNQQISPTCLRQIGRQHLLIVATRSKLLALDDRPLYLDSGDESLNAELAGWYDVVCGFDDRLLYRVAAA